MNFTDKEKHYNTLTRYYQYKFNSKIAKISLNAGFGCPNRDGTKGYGGCSFCSSKGSGDFAGDVNSTLKEQFETIKQTLIKKWPNAKFMPYLQAFSNTYANIDILEKTYNTIINLDEDIVGLGIATRPDCINLEVANLIKEINKKVPVQLELGLQTTNEESMKSLNLGYTLADFENSINLLKDTGCDIVVHIINGLPNESKQDMINNIKYLNQYPIKGIKIHSLLIIKNTKLALDYLKEPFKILTLNEYVDIVCEQIANLRSDIIVHRLAADSNVADLIEPQWTIKKLVVQNEIDKELRKRDLYQGDYNN